MDNPYQAPASAVGPVPGMAHAFRDAAGLTAACRYMLYASIAVSLISIAVSAREIDLLQQAGAGLIVHEEAEEAIVLQSLLLLPLLAVTIACYVVVGMWIYRMAANAWALSGPHPLDHRQDLLTRLAYAAPALRVQSPWPPCGAARLELTASQSCATQHHLTATGTACDIRRSR